MTRPDFFLTAYALGLAVTFVHLLRNDPDHAAVAFIWPLWTPFYVFDRVTEFLGARR